MESIASPFATARRSSSINPQTSDLKMVKTNGHAIQAAILAGGLGTRLKPVLAGRPKVLAPVAGAPFVAHLLRQLDRAGIEDAVLLVGYAAERVRTDLGEQHGRVTLRYSIETEPLGTGGAVQLALPMLHGKTILLLNGDSYCDIDLGAFADFHHRHGRKVSMTVTRVDDASRFGTVALGKHNRIVRFEEKRPVPSPGWINAGIYLIEAELFRSVVVTLRVTTPHAERADYTELFGTPVAHAPGSPTPVADAPGSPICSLERDLLPNWVADREVYGFRGGDFIDIGIPESYARADAFFSQRPFAERKATIGRA